MTRYIQVAIDGNAATGKSTVGALLAQSLGYVFIDSGLLYRALTAEGCARQIDTGDGPSLVALAKSTVIDIRPEQQGETRRSIVLVNGVEVTGQLSLGFIEQATPSVAAHLGVREALIARMREMATLDNVVMAGRDIGSVVLPDADLKVYLSVPLRERARRRHKAALAKNGKSANSIRSILKDLERRDKQDEANSKRAHDAIELPNVGPLEELVERILTLLAKRPQSLI